MGLAMHLLACLLGTGSWVAINGLWVELPLLVPSVPEGWLLPSYLTVVIQLANVGPLLVTLTHRFLPGRLNEVGLIYALLSLGCLAGLLLAFFWGEASVVGGSPRSLALLGLLFGLALVDCTSSVTFLPYMHRLRPHYLTTYFVGEGLSGLLPGLVALGQGVGVSQCVNSSLAGDGDGLRVTYQAPRFSVCAFFLFLSGMMAVSLVAFILLNHLPAAKQERAKEKYQARMRIKSPNGLQVEEGGTPAHNAFCLGSRPVAQMVYIFGLLAWVNALTNGTLPAVQSYSCLPYGDLAYHLSATLAALANPLACFLGMFLPNRSLVLLGALSVAGSLLACYIMAVAVLSPCPPLLHLPAGVILIVLCWVLFVGTLSYVKLMIGMILRDEGHCALVWCGAVVQAGSMVGALSIFPVVSVYGLFHSGDPCHSSCPS
ncbi:solute carrier family 52, riboflavin transporter, member 2 [Sphaerodactylus townsendi]|uniref:solute carrier family 52, riboflavin transporter, member 2 n=1 Tax=Sphaerodactylus townsendi TaxID=933632 RepID=UPI0020264274|nr:solute carrier family 52, riboflavin transporter, member 2 [Sphaerodactylus townsendi]XP_048338519.1 solute carrier family 52, riboflavin transporter, member 2 [Sphaerodactylus townsendi]XP_048338520.1 solute carrier family 52, riboflavin transporter, member 2 [Sphaerodactylus townsendi]